MRDDSIKRHMKRVPRFEGSTVSSVSESDTSGKQIIGAKTGNRSEERTRIEVRGSQKFYEGDRLLQLAGGDSDIPLVFGKNPYIF